MDTPTKFYPFVTVDDLESMPDDGNRYEVIEGEIFMSRAAGLTHQGVSGNLYHSFRNYLDVHPIGRALSTPGIVFSEIDSVIPDMVFFTNERAELIISGERLIAAPDLIVEIVSPGRDNEPRDRVAKRQLCGKFGAREYWIVDPQQRTIEVVSLKDGALTQSVVFREAEDLTSALLPGFSLYLPQVFAI
jgi:Uma2 family endonuclease